MVLGNTGFGILNSMKRRSFIILSSQGLIATGLIQACDTTIDPVLGQSLLIGKIWDEESVRSIGRSYLGQFPAEEYKHKLARLIKKAINQQEGELPQQLQQQIISEFDTAQTVMIDGWILSRTEARQCALFSLI